MNKFKSIAFSTIPAISDVLALKFLIALTRQRIIFPFYHSVSDEELPHIKHLYRIRGTKEFTRDLDYLLKNYEPLDLDQVFSWAKEKKTRSKKGFFLTFDDGLREFNDVIAPILRQKGIPATCFLNSGFIGNKGLFFRYKASLLVDHLQKISVNNSMEERMNGILVNTSYAGMELTKAILEISYHDRNFLDRFAKILDFDFMNYLEIQRPYLDKDQIRSLISQGFSFGAHSIDHPEYFQLSEKDQIFETKRSIEDICSAFGIEYRLFSFPFTDHGIKKSFFTRIFDQEDRIADLTFGGAGLKKDEVRMNIQRIPFEETSLAAEQILKTEYLYFMLKSVFGKNVIRR